MSRLVEPEIAEAIRRAVDPIVAPWLAAGPVLEVNFPASATARDIAHGLGVIPTGVIVLMEVGGHVRCIDVTAWSSTLAFLEADTADTRARVQFVLTKEPINVAT